MSFSVPFSSSPSPFTAPPPAVSTGSPGSLFYIGGNVFDGHTGFGFNIPQGDPGAIEQAAKAMQRLGGGFTDQAAMVRSSATTALEADAGWRGAASASFAEYAGHLIGMLSANAGVCDHVAGALSQLSSALAHAQAVTKQALADCDTYSQAQTKALGDVQAATTAHQTALTNAQSAIDPASKAIYKSQADAAHTNLVNAQSAVTDTATKLSDAKTKGTDAYNTYMQQANALAQRIGGAAGELKVIQAPRGGAPAPLTITPTDSSRAANIMSMWLNGQIKGPLIDAVPAYERTPGLVYSLIADQHAQFDKSLQAGGARGPYTLWSSSVFGAWTNSVNAAVRAGELPPMPANWGQLSKSGTGEQYWQAESRYFSGITCEFGACNLFKVTGSGTASIQQVAGNLARISEWGTIAVCTVGTDGGCIAATEFTFGADTVSNATHASSWGNFFAREGVTTAETLAAGPGLVKAELGNAGKLEGLLPKSTLGKVALNGAVTGPSAGMTALSPQIDQHAFPEHPAKPDHPPKHHHGHQ